jgi:hypothetical protein
MLGINDWETELGSNTGAFAVTIITTDGETVLALEFGVGGRVSFLRNSSARIIGDRQIGASRGRRWRRRRAIAIIHSRS